MAAALLPINFLLVYAAVRRFLREDARLGLLAAATVWGAAAALITEILSALGAFNYSGLVCGWLAAAAIFCAVLFFARPAERASSAAPEKMPLWEAGALAVIVLIAALILVTALAAPPNSWDSMCYHLGRTVHWIQSGNVRHFPTYDLRQVYHPPWSEFILAQVLVLGGGDRLANLPQWFYFLGCLAGVSRIAKELGCRRTGQVFAAAAGATIPMAVTQASGSQNDLAVSLFLIAFVNFGFRLRRGDGGRGMTALAGMSLGLALLAKLTAYIYAVPLTGLLAFYLWKAERRRFWKPLAAVLLIALAFNTAHWARNAELGRLTHSGRGLLMETMRPRFFASNVIRHLSLHFAVPGHRRWNDLAAKAVYGAHHLLGVDPSDPRTTFYDRSFSCCRANLHEDFAGAPWHVALVFLSALAFLAGAGRGRQIGSYGLAAAACFLLFSAVLRWQPWGARLQLPVFLLAMPFAAAVLEKFLRGPALLAAALALFYLAGPWLFRNETRRLIGPENVFSLSRARQYFRNRPELQAAFERAADRAAELKCSTIGIMGFWERLWEYPLWVLLRERNIAGLRLEHVKMENETAALAERPPFSVFAPGIILTVDAFVSAGEIEYRGRTYFKVWEQAAVALYEAR